MNKQLILFLTCSLSLFADSITYTPIETRSPKRLIHLFKVDPYWVEISPVFANDQCLGIETLSSIATRKGAVLAINGGNFQGGRMLGAPDGPFKVDSLACGYRSHLTGAIGWFKKSREAQIDRIRTQAYLNVGGRRTRLDAVNRNLYPANRVAYTSNFHNCTMTPPGSCEYPVSNGVIKRLLTKNGSTAIPHDGFVYTEGKQVRVPLSAASFNRTAKLQIDYQPTLHPDKGRAWTQFSQVVHGTLILDEGKLITDYAAEKVDHNVASNRHARTAIGITREGMWVVAVVEAHHQGRVGMTLTELGRLMNKYGALSAIALDGGGSSTLYYHGKSKQFETHRQHAFSQQNVFYHPEGGERPIGNAIVFK